MHGHGHIHDARSHERKKEVKNVDLYTCVLEVCGDNRLLASCPTVSPSVYVSALLLLYQPSLRLSTFQRCSGCTDLHPSNLMLGNYENPCEKSRLC
jgi:hypothetical protein